MDVRDATHAGTWYSSDPATLRKELDGWLSKVPGEVHAVGPLPYPNARMIIAPHAGYKYSGATAAWAYKALDVTKAKRVFLLGPSHHIYITTCALTKTNAYQTPFGNLRIDREVTQKLFDTGKFKWMHGQADEDEHSLELHLPYIYHILSKHFSEADFPTLIPILVGNTSQETEKVFGELLADYLDDPGSVFVVSSDFAHWGKRFRYTNYLLDLDRPEIIIDLEHYRPGTTENDPPIWKCIEQFDRKVWDTIRVGDHAVYWHELKRTDNTVCGRHPIGIMLAAMQVLARRLRINTRKSNFVFLKYDRSGNVKTIEESSVSYVSMFAIVQCGDIEKELKKVGVYV